MSRIGNKPVEMPKAVELSVEGGRFHVKGPKGALDNKVADGISFDIGDGEVRVKRSGDSPRLRANHGLVRALLTVDPTRRATIDGIFAHAWMKDARRVPGDSSFLSAGRGLPGAESPAATERKRGTDESAALEGEPEVKRPKV